MQVRLGICRRTSRSGTPGARRCCTRRRRRSSGAGRAWAAWPRALSGFGIEIAQTAEESSGWASTFTAAELRLLPLLTSHLTFREIAERLFVSRNTVKTQAISIYRKLDASSRGEAVERAVALGLVDAGPGSRTADFIRSG